MLSTLLHSTTGLGLVAMYTITQISTKAAPMNGRAAKRRKIKISKLEINQILIPIRKAFSLFSMNSFFLSRFSLAFSFTFPFNCLMVA